MFFDLEDLLMLVCYNPNRQYNIFNKRGYWAKFLKERLVDTSDAYTCHVCEICGSIGSQKYITIYYVLFNRAK